MVNVVHWDKLAINISEWHAYAGISTNHQELKYLTLLDKILVYQHGNHSMLM